MRLNKTLFFTLGLLLCISLASKAQVAKKLYHPNGKVKMTFSIIAKNGKGAGLVTLYNKDGKKTQTQTVDDTGRGNGPFSAYYTTGKNSLQMMGFLKNSKVDGKFVTFHQSTGNIETVGQYRNSKKAGVWKFYDKNGKYLKSKSFD